ncbi:putative membrane protein DUF2207 [Tepidamorphus gemmatus]|uniref:Putative membrane protein DUF2207 n=1 Tax=Tepidamorphus gemmatus TaxID=747076 RepID=A0A4R3MAK8_9HYPH|nr:DUF2207 domain-containing protein [Tepidamorphus gemmatus]TCT09299.1 putative membrane protein DUF2207 [Tepidamorphus gemmatus]
MPSSLQLLGACLALVILICGSGPSAAQSVGGMTREEIRSFDARIAVQTDGGVLVTEDIEVVALGREIRRGIYRDVALGGVGVLGIGRATLDIVQTLRDGAPEQHRTEQDGANVRIYLGNPDQFLSPGIYRYRIVYRMSDQARRFDGFDEIYWNVTGNAWSFLILEATAVVVPPVGAPVSQVAAYSGYWGDTGSDVLIDETQNGYPRFRMTRPLQPGEGLTVAVGWPSGFLAPATTGQRIVQWLERWGSLAASVLTLAIVLGYYLVVWHRIGRDPRGGSIIPIYRPTLPPAAMRYIERMGYDTTAFAAALVSLAVKGHVIIDGTQATRSVSVAPGTAAAKPMSDGERVLFDALFTGADKVTLTETSRQRLTAASKALEKHFERTFNRIYFNRNGKWFALGLAITVIGWLAAALLSLDHLDVALVAAVPAAMAIVAGNSAVATWKQVALFRRSGEYAALFGALIPAILLTMMCFVVGVFFLFVGAQIGAVPFVALLLAALVNVVFYHLLKAPTALGRQALDEIEGTRLYMTVAEKDRLKFESPPDKTPEHFHEMLPYAVALDLETAWSAQFKAEIEAARGRGEAEAYLKPSWYRIGSRGRGFSDAGQLRNLGSSLSAALGSATTTRSSGSSGGGGSGGGGGGRGGGGW